MVMMKVAAAALVMAGSVVAQDMRENCVSCGDVKRKCEIDCMLPTYRKDQALAWPNNSPETYEDMSSCSVGCSTDYDSCTETTEQKACFTCMSSCSTSFEANMLSCLQAMEDTTSRATVDDSMDDCSTNATFAMNVCSETCYSADVYGGWTPATEEGVDGEEAGALNTQVPDYRSAASIEDFAAYSTVTSTGSIPAYKKSARAQAKATELAAMNPVDAAASAEEELEQKLGVGGIVGVSGLVATVMLSVGLMTVRHLKSEMAEGETTV